MRLDIGYHQVYAFRLALVGRFEHGIGFAHARGIAQENLEPAASTLLLFSLDAREQFVWVRTL
jgi:hypothetical protein